MRLATLALPLLLASAALTFTLPAFAQQASDADRAAARELFNRGVELQNQQKFADALDQFERSQRVVNAPTILLHVGQCQAALGHLVEAAEAFRSAVRFQLPPSPPAPFVAAQNEATTQLATITPRIPELKITVSPKDIPTLTVTVDDQPVNSALVGISRPTNAGTHKISASAPGYTKAERTLELKEKQNLEVTLTLVSTGGVVYGPSTGDTNTSVTVQPTGSASAATTATPAPTTPPKPADTRSKLSIFLGPRLGLLVPFGNLPNGDHPPTETSISDGIGPGGSLGLEGAVRFARIFFFSILLEGTGFSVKSPSANVTTSATSGLAAGKFGVITNPEGVGFYGTLGAGYRVLDAKATATNPNTLASSSGDQTFQGIQYMLGLGVHFKAGNYIRIIPQAELMYANLAGSAPTIDGTTTDTATVKYDTSQSSSSFYFFLGVGGYFDIDLDKPKPPAPTPSEPASSITSPPSADAAPASAPATPTK